MSTYNLKKATVLAWVVTGMLAILLAATTVSAGETTFSRIVVFGDSLSDPGNDFALINLQNTPPYDNLDPLTIIPHAPYAKGGHHYSNGATWIEQLARIRGMAANVTPAWQSTGTKASNYAVGGARAYDDNINVNLPAQVNRFLADVGGRAPSDALYVLEFGGNDIRDVLTSGNLSLINDAIMSIMDNILKLYGSGATKFLVWNVPDLSLTPAIIALNSVQPGVQNSTLQLVNAYNAGLDALLVALSETPGVVIEIKRFDASAAVRALVANPDAYGLDVVNAACVTPNMPPFDCQIPDEYLFWDGIHPTKTAHDIFAHMVANMLVAP